MKIKIITLGLLISMLSACASIPHYTEEYLAEKSDSYKEHSFEEIWQATLVAIMDLEYTVSVIEKESGFIKAVEEDRLGEGAKTLCTLNFIITKNSEGVSISCRANTRITKEPRKEIEEFFALLEKNIRKSFCY